MLNSIATLNSSHSTSPVRSFELTVRTPLEVKAVGVDWTKFTAQTKQNSRYDIIDCSIFN
jgi:hypothetical protein